MSDTPTTPPPAQPSGPTLKKIEVPEKLIKQEKIEKFEHKEKPEKFEHKEKPEKFEHKEKPEKFEHKEKPEKIEHKEFSKIELIEKLLEVPQDPGGPVEERLATLERGMAAMQHFITTGQRPDLSRGALAAEPDEKKP
jgi:hypothetical protein